MSTWKSIVRHLTALFDHCAANFIIRTHLWTMVELVQKYQYSINVHLIMTEVVLSQTSLHPEKKVLLYKKKRLTICETAYFCVILWKTMCYPGSLHTHVNVSTDRLSLPLSVSIMWVFLPCVKTLHQEPTL